MKNIFVFIIFCLISEVIVADVKIEAGCYAHQSQTSPQKLIYFVLQSYYDEAIKKEVGAFVKYNKSEKIIPLVFETKIDTDLENPGLGNFELRRLEVTSGKVTGLYILIQTGAGNTQGRYINYKNYKTGKGTVFQRLGGPDECDYLR